MTDFTRIKANKWLFSQDIITPAYLLLDRCIFGPRRKLIIRQSLTIFRAILANLKEL